MTDDQHQGSTVPMEAPSPSSHLAHDLRTLLTTVSGRVQLARRRLRRTAVAPGRVDADLELAEEAIVRLVARLQRLEDSSPGNP